MEAHFLQQAAEYVYRTYSNEIQDICLVFPGKRSKIFFKNYLSQLLDKAIWLPSLFSYEEFVEHLSQKNIAKPIDSIIQLYKAYQSVEGENAEGFDSFLKWGNTFLNDINEIDLSLAPADKVFSYLSDAKAISLWDPKEKKLSPYQLKYLKFYRSLWNYYIAYYQLIEEDNKAHRGYIYKKANEFLNESSKKWTKCVFIGFNALMPAERAIINTLKKAGKLDMLWDGDNYYINDKMQEAGFFLREYQQEYGKLNWIGDYLKGNKEIHIIGTPKSINQTKIAGNILWQLSDNKENYELDTAVVLPDEALLFPMLNSIPENIDSVNITMGYSLKYSTFYDFFDTIINLYEGVERFRNARNSTSTLFYNRDLLALSDNKLLTFLGLTKSSIEKLNHAIRKSNRGFWSINHIKNTLNNADSNKIFDLLFALENIDFKHLIALLRRIIELIINELSKNKDNEKIDINLIDRNIALEYQNIFESLYKLDIHNVLFNKLSTFKKFYRQFVRLTQIPFEGHPLEGLQIMGILESRTLDFKNLIILSMNEGIIPIQKRSATLIPNDVKKQFGLPTQFHNDAIYAYHFYRLIQRAENVFLIYNTESSVVGANEKSRFINQIELELKKYSDNIKIHTYIESLPLIYGSMNNIIKIEKTDHIYRQLLENAESGFSPTSLTNYLTCSLRYYFEKILNLQAIQEPQETIEANTLGLAIHEVLEDIYAESKNTKSPVKLSTLSHALSNCEALLMEKFRKIYSDGDLSYGKNLITVKVALKFIQRFLQLQIHEIKENNSVIQIIDTEKLLNWALKIESNKQIIEIKLKGTADRIDTVDNILRIVDYKTGMVNEKDVKIASMEEIVEKSDKSKAFQLLMYAYMFNNMNFQNSTNPKDIVAGIYSFRNIKKGLINLQVADLKMVSSQLLLDFEKQLVQIFEKLFNKDEAFIQTENKNNCKYCPFKGICNR